MKVYSKLIFKGKKVLGFQIMCLELLEIVAFTIVEIVVKCFLVAETSLYRMQSVLTDR